jgi:hypothetical protein
MQTGPQAHPSAERNRGLDIGLGEIAHLHRRSSPSSPVNRKPTRSPMRWTHRRTSWVSAECIIERLIGLSASRRRRHHPILQRPKSLFEGPSLVETLQFVLQGQLPGGGAGGILP